MSTKCSWQFKSTIRQGWFDGTVIECVERDLRIVERLVKEGTENAIACSTIYFAVVREALEEIRKV